MVIREDYDPFAPVQEIGLLDDDDSIRWKGFKLKQQYESNTLSLGEIEPVALPALKSDSFQLELEESQLVQIDPTDHVDVKPDVVGEEERRVSLDNENVWMLTETHRPSTQKSVASWANFRNGDHVEPSLALLSEAGNDLYDAVLQVQTQHAQLRYVDPNTFLSAVKNITVGRESTFFQWNHSRQQFTPLDSACMLTGFSHGCTTNAVNELLQVGRHFRLLTLFAAAPKPRCPSSIALASAVSSVLRALERHLLTINASRTSFLSLHQLATRAHEILYPLYKVSERATSTTDQASFLTSALTLLNQASLQNENLRPLLHEICAVLTKPALDQVRTLGESQNEGMNTNNTPEQNLKSLGLRCERIYKDTLSFRNLIEERQSGKSEPGGIRSCPTRLSVTMAATWSDIRRLHQEADSFESEMLMLNYLQAGAEITHTEHENNDQTTQPVAFDPFTLNFDLSLSHRTQNDLKASDCVLEMTMQYMRDEDLKKIDFTPIQAINLSVSPLLQAENRLTSYEVLKIIFCKVKLLDHLDLLRNFLLLGNDNFVFRLNSSLFETDQLGIMNNSRRANITSLSLEQRESWPPASSDLRLILLNVLSASTNSKTIDDLQNHFSFAIRELSAAEIEKCSNLHSVHALNFLKLAYTSNDTALDLVISTSCLEKYDSIFRHLLLLLRMHHLTRDMSMKQSGRSHSATYDKNLRKSCIELHHLAAQMISYSLEVAIQIPWQPFREHLRQVKLNIEAGSYHQALDMASSPSCIEAQHQEVVEQIKEGLLLCESQTPVLERLMDIFTTALMMQNKMILSHGRESNNIKALSTRALSQLRTFLSTLEMAVKSLDRTKSSTTRLLFERLTLSGFYARDNVWET